MTKEDARTSRLLCGVASEEGDEGTALTSLSFSKGIGSWAEIKKLFSRYSREYRVVYGINNSGKQPRDKNSRATSESRKMTLSTRKQVCFSRANSNAGNECNRRQSGSSLHMTSPVS